MRLATCPSGRRHSSQSRRTLAILLALVPGLVLGGCQQLARGEQTGIRSGSSFKPVQAAPRPTLDIDQAATAAALKAFDSLIEQTDLTYYAEPCGQVDTAVSSSSTPRVTEFKASFDVAGADFAATITVGRTSVQFRGIGPKLWMKASGPGWVYQGQSGMTRTSEILSPWQYLGDLGKLKFVARVKDRPGTLEFTNAGIIGMPVHATNTLASSG